MSQSPVAGSLGSGWFTGIGSMPGTDSRESMRIVAGECPQLPFLPELPARGPGADMVGRSAALLQHLAVEAVPSGWRAVDTPGADMRRARSWLGEDLDALEEIAGQNASAIKVQLCGPWTLAACVQSRGGEALVRDSGARRDVVTMLAEAIPAHIAEVRRRVARADVIVVQIDEPMLSAVASAAVPTASGLATYRGIERTEIINGLTDVVSAVQSAGALAMSHDCSDAPDLTAWAQAGVQILGTPSPTTAAGMDPMVLDSCVAALDAGRVLAPALTALDTTVSVMRRWWRALGWSSQEEIAAHLLLTPQCGFAAARPDEVRAAFTALDETARALVEDPDGNLDRSQS
ncbi:MAG TPA: methionine synthase [Actinobacteria bacterium]|nr:methionine synthase [Actinomycetota bacterium]